MTTIYSPNNIDVLLHCHASVGPHPRIEARAVQEAIDALMMVGAIAPDMRMPQCYTTTPLGHAWVQALCNVPRPKVAFIDEMGRVLES